MKTFSVSFTALLIGLMAISVTLPNLGRNVAPTSRVANITAEVARPFGGSYSGNYPANSGYHNYGWYAVDASAVSIGSYVTINYQSYDVPNRFYLVDNCGLGTSKYSGDPNNYNNWVGSASYGGPWSSQNSVGINYMPSGNISLLKTAACNSYQFQVETSTGRLLLMAGLLVINLSKWAINCQTTLSSLTIYCPFNWYSLIS